LSVNLDARGPSEESLASDGLSWILERAGARETGGAFDDVWFQLIPAADTTQAVEISDETGDEGSMSALQLSEAAPPASAPETQLWQLVPLPRCDM
jgi:hypothetical protein